MIDTHCHIDVYPDPHAILAEVARQRILTVAVTNLPSHYLLASAHVRAVRTVRLALGLHPLLVDKHSDAELRKFKELAATTSYIGEVGLDYSREGRDTAEQQMVSFRFVLDTIRNRPRFVTLHSRGAEADVFSLLGEYGVTHAVFHWYSGPLTLVDKLVAASHYLSVNPAMVRSSQGRKIIERVPRERVLTETDGPYVMIGERSAKPADVTEVLRYLSTIWSVNPAQAEQQIFNNFQAILEPIKRWQTQRLRQ